MADFSALIQRIKDAVFENGVQAITGQILQDCLKDVVNTVNVAKQDGIYRVTVTVDNNTGVPSATASMDDDTYTLEFSFHNLKGETGPQGPQGDTPVLTADSDGVIYSDGVMLTRVIKDTTDALTTRADSDHARAESDHARAETDHTDITRARLDAETAAGEANYASLRANTAADNADAAREAIQSDLAQKQDVIPDLQQIRAGATDTVKYSTQSLTDAQKEQARTNIGAASDSEVSQLRSEVVSKELIGFDNQAFKIRNGAQASAGNAWVVTLYGYSTLAIPVTPGHIYRLVINKEPQSGFHFYWRLGVYTTSTPTNLYSNIVRDEYNSWNVYHTDSDIFDIRENEYGVSIQLTELTAPGAAQAAGTCVALRASDFSAGDIILLDVTESQLYHVDTVVNRNNDKIPALVNACLRGKTSANSKNIQLLVCADHHGWSIAHKNAVRATNGFGTVDAYVNVGDIMPSYYLSSQITKFQREFGALTKPGYIVVGNHDVGNCYYAGYACDHQQAYNAYIKPMVDNGWLSSGEYEANKPYWHHDNATYKVRLIGLYEYDDNLDFNETYWKAIEYDSSLPKLTFNTAYQTGAKVNAGDHTSHSFEAAQNVTTPANYYTTPSKLPSYIVQRGTRVIRQTQAQWFLDTLASTPASYGVIVIMHNPFSDNAVSMEKKFSWPANVNGSSYSQNSMTTDFVRNAIAAFMAGNNYSEKVVMKGNAAYLNTLNDGTIDYAYEVSKNFAQKNTGVYLLGLLGGHSHRDIIWKDPSQNIYQVAPNCAIVDGSNDKNGDVRRTNTDGIAADSLTVVSFSSGRIALVKIGVNVTENGTDRDYEVISY